MGMEIDKRQRSLRERAEALLNQVHEKHLSLSPDDIGRLIHDLSVYQIELELQNEDLRSVQNQLETTRDRYAQLYHQAPVGYLSLDRRGIIQQVNQTFADLLGCEGPDLIGQALADFMAGADREMFLSRFRAFFNQPANKTLDTTLHGQNNRSFVARLMGRHDLEVHTTLPSEPRLLAIVHDITEQQRAAEALLEQSAILQGITDSAQDAILMLDTEGRIAFWNPAAERIFGYTPDEALGQDLHQLLAPGRYHEAHHQAFGKFRETGHGNAIGKTLELSAYHKDGSEIAIALSLSAVHIQNQWRSVGILRDETQRQAQERELRRLATTDHLTGMANRRHFLKQLDLELQRFKRYAAPATLLMIDLDHFKQVNDTYGHAAGDQMLQHFANIAQALLRHTDLIGRLGGEEFAVLLPATDLEGARLLAERLRGTVANTSIPWESRKIALTVSIGITRFSSTDEELGSILNRADRALYQAKEQGRNQTVNHPALKGEACGG